MGMKIQTQQIGDVAVLSMSGDMDSRSNQLLDKTLKALIQSSIYKVILDVSMLRFIGNQTISVLISNMKEMRAAGGNIKFLNPQRMVIEYLKQNRIFEIFEIYSSRAEAVKSYADVVTQTPPKTAINSIDNPPNDKTEASSTQSQQRQPAPARSSAADRSAYIVNNAKTAKPAAPEQPADSPKPKPISAGEAQVIKNRFETDEIIYANSCMLVTLIKILETKGILNAEEAGGLLDHDMLTPDELQRSFSAK
ncbi:MAG: STAS domain-containing protein [Candidatus Hinthialibacter antarcticus]|nr:STAS domain-containing protein [Candidatus Hinthialibacter antarcticus]